MLFEEKKITLKDGKTVVLKSPCVEDSGVGILNVPAAEESEKSFPKHFASWL